MRAAEAQRQAEAMQRDPKIAIERYVDGLPGLLDRERALLKTYPMLLAPENSRLLQSEFNAALGEGLARDSEAFQNRVLSGVVRHIEARQQRQAEGVKAATVQPPPMAEPSIERMAERLDHEASAIHSAMRVADATPVVLAANLPAPEPPMPARRSLPISAPVSREIPNQAGQRISPTDTRITLNPAEREIARSSYHWLPKDQAENLYARQKQKLAAMRKAGTYSE